ncbi:MAG: hypothetical protein ABJF04_04430 [Reichenbachiella sp.]|uniref:hypothetical protein n=1 Tax=Reichenbachiella sp. TaxID=2184521 RepID=UPI003267361E
MKRINFSILMLGISISALSQNTIGNSGNVGIGTGAASPEELLHINSDVADAVIKIQSDGSQYGAINFSRERLSGENVVGGSIYMQSNTSSNDATLSIDVNTATGPGNINGPHIDIMRRSSYPTNFINLSNANVGIGTSTPAYTLDVHGNIRAKQHLITGGELSNGRIYIRDVSGNQKILLQSDGFSYFNSGYVGIGTGAPSYLLDVNGSVRFGDSDDSGLTISEFTSALAEVPGSTSGMQIKGPVHAHVVVDIQGNDQNDGFYIRVPETLQVNPVVNKMAFVVKANGNVGIGVNPSDKLTVDGRIRSEEVKVEIVNGPDYVFEDNYELLTLQETKQYISTNKHLPEIPSAKEMETNGVDVGEMNMRLLKKIEELTLHMIRIDEELQQLKSENAELKKR